VWSGGQTVPATTDIDQACCREPQNINAVLMPQGVTFSAAQRCSGVRLSPKSIFFGIVALGLPIVVTAGWILGASEPPSSSPRPGGATGFGTPPVNGISWGPAGEAFSPAPPRPVAAQTRVPAGKPRGGRTARPSATGEVRPEPTTTARPVPSATEATAAPTDLPTAIPTTLVPIPEP
jgi:hypothetical protein